ncbi:uncharacterized protein LY89DRAFT_676744 [Mollisia scopiformis]|uniref:Uncharacterized protein n=1 Tax=Mollisia scopiformis TaxID=149040 RepID=A0A132B901_MOLSC|nr:uncharacterized protein LY89DRAFT_676744 [Mollisia scopiformis]KUJ08851.1 hypothetical protein LY89DRAFT_676744 [Mollisia scopiformis]
MATISSIDGQLTTLLISLKGTCILANLESFAVLGCDKTMSNSKNRLCNSSTSDKSSSVKLSMRASRSRSTLVGYDDELEYKLDTAHGSNTKVKKLTWPDHLLGVFCIKRGSRVSSTMLTMPIRPEEDQGNQPSPWILSVYVLSRQKDESRHFIPKEAKCTIDTGNLQGNLVSRAFVTDVLGYSESHFQPLTKAEEVGGTGVTGHKLIPQGAISLTWYHSNSTRVFRDMRFLISEHPMYDLIIGSQSIHQNRILDVPNLGDDPHLVSNPVLGGKLASIQLLIPALIDNFTAEELEKCRDRMTHLKGEYSVIHRQAQKKKNDTKLQETCKEVKAKLDAAEKAFDVEHRRFQIHRYWVFWAKHPEGKGRKKAHQDQLDKWQAEWHEAFPGEGNIPAENLTSLQGS